MASPVRKTWNSCSVAEGSSPPEFPVNAGDNPQGMHLQVVCLLQTLEVLLTIALLIQSKDVASIPAPGTLLLSS